VTHGLDKFIILSRSNLQSLLIEHHMSVEWCFLQVICKTFIWNKLVHIICKLSDGSIVDI
jgi:hypothetical protein